MICQTLVASVERITTARQYGQDKVVYEAYAENEVLVQRISHFYCVLFSFFGVAGQKLHVSCVPVYQATIISQQQPAAPPANVRFFVEYTAAVQQQYLLYHHGKLCGLLALAGTMAVVLTGFLSYHVYLVLKGTTTNESAKWGEVRGAGDWVDVDDGRNVED